MPSLLRATSEPEILMDDVPWYIDHAWVEHNGMAYDNWSAKKNGYKAMPTEDYYKMLKVKDPKYYTHEVAMANAAKTEHYGPWSAQELSKEAMGSISSVNPVNYQYEPLVQQELDQYGQLDDSQRAFWKRKTRDMNQRAMRREQPGTLAPNELYGLVHRYDNSCAYCEQPITFGGQQQSGTFDHVIPLGQGGENAVHNVVPSCVNCNQTINEWTQGRPFSRHAQRISSWLEALDLSEEAAFRYALSGHHGLRMYAAEQTGNDKDIMELFELVNWDELGKLLEEEWNKQSADNPSEDFLRKKRRDPKPNFWSPTSLDYELMRQQEQERWKERQQEQLNKLVVGSNYEAAQIHLQGGRNPDVRRPFLRNTWLERRDPNTIAMRLHDTDIVTYKPGQATFNTGGWYSMTTKDRMNNAQHATIFSRKPAVQNEYGQSVPNWWVSTAQTQAKSGANSPWGDEEAVPYYDGITIGDDGTILSEHPGSKYTPKWHYYPHRRSNKWDSLHDDGLPEVGSVWEWNPWASGAGVPYIIDVFSIKANWIEFFYTDHSTPNAIGNKWDNMTFRDWNEWVSEGRLTPHDQRPLFAHTAGKWDTLHPDVPPIGSVWTYDPGFGSNTAVLEVVGVDEATNSITCNWSTPAFFEAGATGSLSTWWLWYQTGWLTRHDDQLGLFTAAGRQWGPPEGWSLEDYWDSDENIHDTVNPAGLPRPLYDNKPVPWSADVLMPIENDQLLPEPNFKNVDTDRHWRSWVNNLCTLCGTPLTDPVYAYFNRGGENGDFNPALPAHNWENPTHLTDRIVDGGLHERCAVMTRAHCPHIRDNWGQNSHLILKTTPLATFETFRDEGDAGDHPEAWTPVNPHIGGVRDWAKDWWSEFTGTGASRLPNTVCPSCRDQNVHMHYGKEPADQYGVREDRMWQECHSCGFSLPDADFEMMRVPREWQAPKDDSRPGDLTLPDNWSSTAPWEIQVVPDITSGWAETGPNGDGLTFQLGDRVELPSGHGLGTVIEVDTPEQEEDGTFTTWMRVKKDDGQIVQVSDSALRFVQGLEGGAAPDTLPWRDDEQDYYRTSMAERTGDPTLDKLIEEFIYIENLSDHPITSERYPHAPDADPTSLYSDGEWARGNCGHIANTFEHFLKAKGINARSEGQLEWAPQEIGYEVEPNSWAEPDANDGGLHTATIVDMPSGSYMIDWTARQYGDSYTFPHVQRLNDGGSWDRQWTSALPPNEREMQEARTIRDELYRSGEANSGDIQEKIIQWLMDELQMNYGRAVWISNKVLAEIGNVADQPRGNDPHTSATDALKSRRIPFYLYPNGYDMGQPGQEHWEIEGGDASWNSGDPHFDQAEIEDHGPYQGHVIFDPEHGEVATWPYNAMSDELEEPSWITPEMKERVLADARQRWQQHTSATVTSMGEQADQLSDDNRAPGYAQRVPFFLSPNGAFSMGNVGDEHWEIPDSTEVNQGLIDHFKQRHPEFEPDGEDWRSLQGHVMYDPSDPSIEAAQWPLSDTTEHKNHWPDAEWITPEMRQRVLDAARQRWQEHLAQHTAAAPQVMYHATWNTHWPWIMKNGLTPGDPGAESYWASGDPEWADKPNPSAVFLYPDIANAQDYLRELDERGLPSPGEHPVMIEVNVDGLNVQHAPDGEAFVTETIEPSRLRLLDTQQHTSAVRVMYHVSADGGHEQTGFNEGGLFLFDSIDEAINFGNGWLEKQPDKFLYSVTGIDPSLLGPDEEWEQIEEEENEHAYVYNGAIPPQSVRLLDHKQRPDYWKAEDYTRLTGQTMARVAAAQVMYHVTYPGEEEQIQTQGLQPYDPGVEIDSRDMNPKAVYLWDNLSDVQEDIASRKRSGETFNHRVYEVNVDDLDPQPDRMSTGYYVEHAIEPSRLRLLPVSSQEPHSAALDDAMHEISDQLPWKVEPQRVPWTPQLPDKVIQQAIYKHQCPMCRSYLRDRGGVYTCASCPFEWPPPA